MRSTRKRKRARNSAENETDADEKERGSAAPVRPESVQSLPGGGLLASWTSANGQVMKTVKLPTPSVGSAHAKKQTNRERAQLLETVAHAIASPPNTDIGSDVAVADRFALFQKLVARPYFGDAFNRLTDSVSPQQLSVNKQLDLFQLLRCVLFQHTSR